MTGARSAVRSEMRGVWAITWNEYINHTFSARMFIVVIILLLCTVAGTYGISLMTIKPEASFMPIELKGHEAGFVLYMVSFLVAMIASVCALIMGFDAFLIERMDNMDDILRSMPVSAVGIATAKFLGIFLSLAIPLVSMQITSIYIVQSITLRCISIYTAFIYILLTLMLVASMVLIQIVISLLAKNIGNAIMGGVGIWFLYTVFWLLVSLSVAQFMGVDLSPKENLTVEELQQSEEFSYISNRVDLFNPIGAYHLCTGILLSGGNEVITVPHIYPYLALTLWVIVPYIIMIYIYSRKGDF